MSGARPLLVSGDADLIDDILRLAAANGVEVHLATDAESARSRWSLAPLVLVGADAAASVAGTRPTRRRDVVLVGRDPSPEDWQRAVALGAEHVASLPDAERWLIDRLADSGEGMPRNGVVVAVLSAGSGAGASTLAATLGLAAAARSTRVLLIDGDPLGGGLDVLLGLEGEDGTRWPDLCETRGRLSAVTLAEALPRLHGMSVLSWGREGPASAPVESWSAVVDAGVRGFDLVVVDLARQLDPVGELVLARARETVVVASNHVRTAVAASRLAASVQSLCSSVGLVLRSDPKGVDVEAVLSTLAIPVIGRVPFVGGMVGRSDAGEPPSLRDTYGRAVTRLLPLVSDLARDVAS